MSTPKYDYGFDPEAANNTAATIHRLAAAGGRRVLDLGSGPGVVASALAAEGHEVVCVDSDVEALAVAADRGVGRTVVGDLRVDDWVDEVAGEPYDTVILADVLEHLVDPGALLDLLQDRGLLAPDGQLVVSVPNVSHEAVLFGLALGRFRYTETGLLDATHLRFFTRDSLFGLLEQHRFVVRVLDRTQRTIEQTEQFQIARDVPSELRRQLSELSPDARTYQFVVAASPATEAGHLAVLRQRLEDERDVHVRELERVRKELRSEVEAARAEVERIRTDAHGTDEQLRARAAEQERLRRRLQELEEARARAEEEAAAAAAGVASLRAEATTATAAADRARREAEQLRTALRRVEDRLDKVYESTSFKLGWKLTAPVRAVRGGESEPVRPPRITDPSDRAGTDGARGEPAATEARAPAPGLPREQSSRRAAYDAQVARASFSPGVTGVVMLCSTTDLDAGRGDIFAATGLGLELEAHGMEAVYRGHDRWHELPAGTDVVVSFLAEESMILDPATVPADVLRVAWIRNNTKRWIAAGSLGLYDLVLCSSQLTADEVAEHYDGPIELLSLGVDPDLFAPGASGRQDAVVSTINQWGKTRRTFRALAGTNPDVPLHLYGRTNNLDERLAPHARGLVSYFEVPSLYQQAAVVLDDQQGVNAPYGNVNSRIYEALAAGALPITGSTLGLEEAGLGDVPSWDSDDELPQLLAYWTTHPEERQALVERLRGVVLERHTFRGRAERFVELVADRPRRTPPVIGFHPDYRITNPFQDMTYAAAGHRVARPVDGPAQLLDAPGLSDHPRVFHLHWVATVFGPAGADPDEAQRRVDAFLEELDRARAGGVRFVWTIHNVLLHESRHPELEVRFRQALADRADMVHVLSEATVRAVAEAGYRLPPDRTFVGTHPSYLGMYPSAISREAARRELRIPESAFVYLVLGQIRPYKGLERVLEAFDGLAQDQADARLLVAGMPGKFEGVQDLLAQARDTLATTVVDRHVDDDELQVFLRACDVVVLPHRRVLNSGLLWLAWSFGRPVVAPDTGALSDLVDDEVGVLFAPDAEDLRPALEAARRLGPVHGRAAFARAEASRAHDVSAELLGRIDEATSG